MGSRRPCSMRLQIIHAADFLHGDIAPDNVLIRADGTPVLLDFGSARRAVAKMSRSVTGIVKAGYSPHEQYSSDGRLLGPWSDIYALGGTLYRAVAGHPPEEATLRMSDDRMVPMARRRKRATARLPQCHRLVAAPVAARPSRIDRRLAQGAPWRRPHAVSTPMASAAAIRDTGNTAGAR